MVLAVKAHKFILCPTVKKFMVCGITYFKQHLILLELAKRPPSAAFCSPFGGGRYKNDIWDRHTHGTDTQKTCIFGRHRKTVFMLKSFLLVARSVHK